VGVGGKGEGVVGAGSTPDDGDRLEKGLCTLYPRLWKRGRRGSKSRDLRRRDSSRFGARRGRRRKLGFTPEKSGQDLSPRHEKKDNADS
jgi:hypothetical protein